MTKHNAENVNLKDKFAAFLAENGLTAKDVRGFVGNDGKNRQTRDNAAKAVSEAVKVPSLDGLNLSALEMVFAFASASLPSDDTIEKVTRPDVYKKALEKARTDGKKPSEADLGAAVRSASQCWRCLLANGWKVTISKGGQTFTK